MYLFMSYTVHTHTHTHTYSYIYIYIYIYICKHNENFSKIGIPLWFVCIGIYLYSVTVSLQYVYTLICLWDFISMYTLFGWLIGWFYGISTFVSYLTPNPFLCKLSALL